VGRRVEKVVGATTTASTYDWEDIVEWVFICFLGAPWLLDDLLRDTFKTARGSST